MGVAARTTAGEIPSRLPRLSNMDTPKELTTLSRILVDMACISCQGEFSKKWTAVFQAFACANLGDREERLRARGCLRQLWRDRAAMLSKPDHDLLMQPDVHLSRVRG